MPSLPIGILCICSLLCLQRTSISNTDDQPTYEPTVMSDLSLKITLSASQTQSGASLGVQITLTNSSGRVLQVQEPYGVEAPPLHFIFRSSPGGDILYDLSREEVHARLLGHDTPPPVELKLVELKPGASLYAEDDLGALTLNPITAGNYFVCAEWRQPGLGAISDFAKLQVLELSPWERVKKWFCWWC